MSPAARAAALLLLFGLAPTAAAANPAAAARRVREPVDLAFSADGTRLVTANRRSGSLSVVDPRAAAVVAEFDVGDAPVALAPLPDGRRWLVLDRGAGALLVVEFDGDRAAKEVGRVPLPVDPVAMAWDASKTRGIVAGLEGRALVVLSRPADGSIPEFVGRVALPFPPRCVAVLDGGDEAVVADAYAGRLALIDLARPAVRIVRRLAALNIRGLIAAPDGRSILLTHQELSPAARADYEGVHWGRLLNNHLRTIRLHSLRNAADDAGALDGSLVFDLGSFGNGAGDPAGLAADAQAGIAVALSGVNEVSVGPHATDLRRRVRVGARPLAVAFAPDRQAVWSADALDDSVSVVGLSEGGARRPIALGPRPAPDAVSRGERLFHDAGLSHDRWLSCQSCHADGQTTGGRADTLGDRSYGAPKLIPPLLGTGQTGPWAWNGSVERLEDQVRKSIVSTMQGEPPTDDQVLDLTAYLRSLAPRPARRDDAAGAGSIARGAAVFEARSCANCHAPPSYTTPDVFDVGLADERGRKRFNPPSLRGVGLRAPYLHDGRSERLEDVFLEHRHPRGARWSPAEVDDLAAFLRSL